jgi:hypothetical protein
MSGIRSPFGGYEYIYPGVNSDIEYRLIGFTSAMEERKHYGLNFEVRSFKLDEFNYKIVINDENNNYLFPPPENEDSTFREMHSFVLFQICPDRKIEFNAENLNFTFQRNGKDEIDHYFAAYEYATIGRSNYFPQTIPLLPEKEYDTRRAYMAAVVQCYRFIPYFRKEDYYSDDKEIFRAISPRGNFFDFEINSK